jgi:predicted phage terminase large subunit-like protein
MGCGITGFGAGKLREAFGGCIIIDDPLKAQDYRSPAARESAMAYINATLKSRRNRKDTPTTPMVLIMQRLHPQDPAGQLLQQERDQWTVVKIPAINELGESIWPGRIGLEELAMMKDVDPDTYWAQYMQEPSTSKTTIFKPEWWRYWRDRREMEKSITLKIITADTAFEEKTSADWSVFQCWGFVSGAGMVLLDQIRGQWGYPDLTKAVKLFWEKHSSSRPKELGYSVTPATELWIENKASGISIIQTLRSVGIPARKWEPKDKTPKDKVGRAKHSTMPLAAGRIYIPDPKMLGFEWVDRFVNEATCFAADGGALNDDQVDAYTEASSIWQERGGGVGPMPFV